MDADRVDVVVIGAGLAGSRAGEIARDPAGIRGARRADAARGGRRALARRGVRPRPQHDHGPITTGDDRDGIISPADREEVRAFVRARLEDVDPDPVGELTCLYTSTATEDFILDRHGPFVVCSACSGHGAKFAPLTGELAADLACGGPDPDGPSNADRFTLAAHGG